MVIRDTTNSVNNGDIQGILYGNTVEFDIIKCEMGFKSFIDFMFPS